MGPLSSQNVDWFCREKIYIFTYVNTRLILLVFYVCVLKTAALYLAYIRLYNSLFRPSVSIGQEVLQLQPPTCQTCRRLVHTPEVDLNKIYGYDDMHNGMQFVILAFYKALLKNINFHEID